MNKAKNDSAYFIWSASILLCMILAFFTLIFTSCAGDKDKANQTPTSINDPSGTANPDAFANNPDENPAPDNSTTPGIVPPADITQPVELIETADMGQEYVDKFYFLGDSTTNGLAHYEIVDKTHVWTPTNGTLTLDRWNVDAVYDRATESQVMITEAVRTTQPEYLLITLGVNGVSFMTEEVFSINYTNLVAGIKEASPNTKIILNSIYPVSVNYATSSINNAKIDVANGWIRKIAEESGVHFLNSSSVLKDESGNLVETYHNGDFIHPNSECYGVVINYLRTHGLG